MITWQCRVAFERIKYGIARRIGANIKPLESDATTEELHPAQIVSGPASVVLPNQYERIRACGFGVDVAKEVAEVKGAPRDIGPVLKFTAKDVLIDNGIIYGRGTRKIFNNEISFDPTRQSWIDFDEVVLRSSFIGCYFFGHWLRDDCATHLLAESWGAPLSMPTPSWPDMRGYLDLFKQNYMALHRGHAKRLTFFYDICNNSHKIHRFRTLRSLVRSQASGASEKIIYLMRGAGGQERALINEVEIVNILRRRGITIVEAETLDVPQLVTTMLGAKIVIGVEGSQFSHALLTLREGGGVIVIQPPDRFFNSHMDWVRAMNMRYGLVVGEPRNPGFYLPVEDLLRTIDLMDVELR